METHDDTIEVILNRLKSHLKGHRVYYTDIIYNPDYRTISIYDGNREYGIQAIAHITLDTKPASHAQYAIDPADASFFPQLLDLVRHIGRKRRGDFLDGNSKHTR